MKGELLTQLNMFFDDEHAHSFNRGEQYDIIAKITNKNWETGKAYVLISKEGQTVTVGSNLVRIIEGELK